MTDVLDELARREMDLLAHVQAVGGSPQGREHQLRGDGTFAELAAIHVAYVTLAEGPWSPTSFEALKRAVFTGWYETAEPSGLTGIGDLDAAAVQREYRALGQSWDEGGMDDEFEAMLGWYWHTAGEHFKRCADAYYRERLVKSLRMLDRRAYTYHGFRAADLEGRGRMGVYWISLACDPA